jgi:hypothetical protein
MAQTPACSSAEAVLQRAMVGAPVSEREIQRALEHVAFCQACGPRFEVRPGAAWRGLEQENPLVVSEDPVEPGELFQRALIAALSSPETIARRRAAQRLGGFEEIGLPALEALARAASEDSDEEVREAALVALDQLDEQVSIPQRVIDAWSAEPAEAVPFITGVLLRLAGTAAAAPRVTRLVATPRPGEGRATITGEGGVEGSVTRERDELWLELNSLPASLEQTSPVLAVPRALEPEPPPVEWSQRQPGLVAAPGPVAQGSLRLRLGTVAESPAGEGLFDELYLLSPQRRRARR